MSTYVGDFAVGSTFDIKFCTVTTTGAPTQLAGTPVISAYVDNSTTQLTAGITLTEDFDGVTGLNNVRVVATGANGYAAGSNYQLVITTGTVGGTSVVGYVVAQFSLEARSSLRPTTAGRTLDVSAGGEAGVDWANVGSPTTTVGLSGTTIKDATDVETKLGTPAGASVSADIAAIEAQTDDIGAAGAGLTAIPWNAAWDAEVQSEVDDALVAQRLDEILNADSDIDGAAPPTVGSVVHEMLSKTAGSFTFDQTTDSLEAIRDKETDIETDTAEIGVAGAGLTNINLPDQTMNITGDITGNLSGSVGSVTGAVGSVTGAVGSVAAGGIAASSFAAGAIDAAAIATDAIDADAIAANAIGASELASDVITDIWQGTALTEAYAADGAAATPAQLLYMIWSLLAEANVSSTTLTAKKLDGSTTSMTFTLDSATAPTTITRAT